MVEEILVVIAAIATIISIPITYRVGNSNASASNIVPMEEHILRYQQAVLLDPHDLNFENLFNALELSCGLIKDGKFVKSPLKLIKNRIIKSIKMINEEQVLLEAYNRFKVDPDDYEFIEWFKDTQFNSKLSLWKYLIPTGYSILPLIIIGFIFLPIKSIMNSQIITFCDWYVNNATQVYIDSGVWDINPPHRAPEIKGDIA